MLFKGIPEEVAIRVVNSVNQLRTRDEWLLKEKIHEQSISSRLAMYLQHEFPAYDVDCEYNRHIKVQKRMGSFEKDYEGRPDIVVHKRGSDEYDLLVVEVKKHPTRDLDRSKAILKLKDLTMPVENNRHFFGYKYGLLFEIISENLLELNWFVGGDELESTYSLELIESNTGLISFRVVN